MAERNIANAKLDRIEKDAHWAKMHNGVDKMLTGFRRDHGNLLFVTKDGTIDILYLHDGDTMKSRAAHILQHAAPDTMTELVYGYRLAKKAGLLDTARTNGKLDELRKNPDPPAVCASLSEIAYAAFDKWVAKHEDEVGHLTLLEQIDAYKSAWDKLVENPTDRP